MSETHENAIRALLEVMTLMVRADGTVDHEEIMTFMETVSELAPFDTIAHDKLFRLAQQVGGQAFERDTEAHLLRMADVLNPELRLRAYELAHGISTADGARAERETTLLRMMQRVFGLSDEQVRQIEKD